MHKVLKPFPCCFDGSGLRAEDLKAGDVREFPLALVAGLENEGYIEPVTEPAAAVQQPAAPEPGPPVRPRNETPAKPRRFGK